MTEITLHGWTVEIDPDNEFTTLISTEIPFHDNDRNLHFFNAAAGTLPDALRSLADKLGAAVKVMIWLNDCEDRTYEKVHEFVAHLIQTAYALESARLAV